MKKAKISALLLALIMMFSVLGGVNFAAQAENAETTDANVSFSDVNAGTPVGNAVAKLVAYGIMNGYPEGTFKPDGEITRAEFAAVIARFKNLTDGLVTDAVTGFSDLDSDESRAWARPYVKAAVDAKIINGFEDGTYRAGEPVTYEQAIKMLICAIEYEPVALSELNKLKITAPDSVTWSSGYIAVANKISVTKNAISADVTAPATRGTVAILASNALDAPKLNVTTDKNGNVSYSQDKETVSSDRYDTKEEVEGVVIGTYYTGAEEEFVDISKKELLIRTNDGDQVYEMSSSVQKSVDLEDILGKKILAYYSKDSDNIVSLTEKNNEVVRINEEDIISISGETIKYNNEKDKIQSLTVSGANYIYNGKYLEDASLSDFGEDGKYELKSGYIEYVKGGSVKLCKITSYEVFVVNSFDRTNKKVFFKYDQKFNGEKYYEFPAKSSEVPEIYLNGKATQLDNLSLSAYDVINFAFSPKAAGGNEINRMFITRGAKSGKITAKLDGDRELEIDDKSIFVAYNYDEYEPEASGEQKAPFELDETYSYYLDYMGQIAAVKYSASTSSSYKYGYIMTAGEDKSTNSVLIRMINESGADIKYGVKANIKIDGKKVSDDEVLEVLQETAAKANKSYYNANGGSSDNEYNQPVRYSLSGGVIDGIDTVVTNEGGSSDSLSYDVKYDDGTITINSKTSIKTPGDFGTVSVGTNTKVFFIPSNRNDYNSYNKLSYDKAFARTGKRNMEILAIDTTSSSKSAAVVLLFDVDPSLAFVYNSPYMIVSDISVSGDQHIFEGYANASTSLSKITVSEDKFTTSIDDSDKFENNLKSAEPEEVGKGDIIRYLLDGNKEVIAIQIIYDASNPSQNKKADSVSAAYDLRCDDIRYDDATSTTSFRYGVPVTVNLEEKRINFAYVLPSDELEVDYNEKAVNYACSSAKIFEYTKQGVNVLETMDSIFDIDSGTPSTIIIVSNSALKEAESSATAKLIYVINE